MRKLAVILSMIVLASMASAKGLGELEAKKTMKTRVLTAPEIQARYNGVVAEDSIAVTSFAPMRHGERIVFVANVYYKVNGDRHMVIIWVNSPEGAIEKRAPIKLAW